jgi:beta-phosphoglucomutase
MYKYLIEGKKAALFDLDGTLVDTEPLWRISVEQTMIKEGGVPVTAEDLITKKGLQDTVKWQTMLDKGLLKTTKTAVQLSQENHEFFINMIKNFPLTVNQGFWELADVLKNSKGFKLGLTTNTDKETARQVLDKIGIKTTFDIYVFGNDVKKAKPDPEMYLKAANELHLSPKEILVFEDSPSGAAAADKAGMDVVVLWDGQTPEDEYPKKTLLYIRTFDDLVNNLDQNFNEAFKDFQKQILRDEKPVPDVNPETQKPLQ